MIAKLWFPDCCWEFVQDVQNWFSGRSAISDSGCISWGRNCLESTSSWIRLCNGSGRYSLALRTSTPGFWGFLGLKRCLSGFWGSLPPMFHPLLHWLGHLLPCHRPCTVPWSPPCLLCCSWGEIFLRGINSNKQILPSWVYPPTQRFTLVCGPTRHYSQLE